MTTARKRRLFEPSTPTRSAPIRRAIDATLTLAAAIRELASVARQFIASASPSRSENENSAGTMIEAAAIAEPIPPAGIWISADSPAWPAWDAFYREQKGKSPPRDAKNGWRFAALTPPATH